MNDHLERFVRRLLRSRQLRVAFFRDPDGLMNQHGDASIVKLHDIDDVENQISIEVALPHLANFRRTYLRTNKFVAPRRGRYQVTIQNHPDVDREILAGHYFAVV